MSDTDEKNENPLQAIEKPSVVKVSKPRTEKQLLAFAKMTQARIDKRLASTPTGLGCSRPKTKPNPEPNPEHTPEPVIDPSMSHLANEPTPEPVIDPSMSHLANEPKTPTGRGCSLPKKRVYKPRQPKVELSITAPVQQQEWLQTPYPKNVSSYQPIVFV